MTLRTRQRLIVQPCRRLGLYVLNLQPESFTICCRWGAPARFCLGAATVPMPMGRTFVWYQ